VLLVEEQQPLLTVHRVEANLWRVSHGLEEFLCGRRRAFGCDPIQVGVLALERRMEAILRPHLDRHPAKQPERHVLPLRLLGDA
jgi:hypothetical protein